MNEYPSDILEKMRKEAVFGFMSRMQSILDQHPLDLEKLEDLPSNLKSYLIDQSRYEHSIEFQGTNSEESTYVQLGVAYTEEAKEQMIEDFSDIPGDFEYPVYSFWAHSKNSDRRLTTPYGPLISYVIGLDNMLYEIENTYLFSSDGRGLKREKITLIDLISDVELNTTSDLEVLKAPKLNTIPSENTNFADINPNDFEEIKYYLNQIENGRFIIVR